MSANREQKPGQEWVPVPDLNDLVLVPNETSQQKEQALVHRIETLGVYDSERVNLIMVWKGLAPTANFIISPQNSPLSPEQLAALVHEAEVLFTDMGLKFSEKTDHAGRQSGARFYQVARSEGVLTEFIGIDFKDRKNAEKIGLEFGLPHTAAQAYAKGPQFLIRDEDIPQKYRSKDFMAFSKFWFSREHWQDELETVRRWADEVRRTDPALYDRLVAYHRVFPFPLFKIGHVKNEEVPPWP